VLDLTFETGDGEDVASSKVMHDPGDKQTQTLRVVGGAKRPVGRDVQPVRLLGTERFVERAEALAGAPDIGGDGLFDGAGKFEEVSVGRGTHPIRVHPRTVTVRR
jgi:hypothetical protein